jgi:hypothetical protein
MMDGDLPPRAARPRGAGRAAAWTPRSAGCSG